MEVSMIFTPKHWFSIYWAGAQHFLHDCMCAQWRWIRIFAFCRKTLWILGYPQDALRMLWFESLLGAHAVLYEMHCPSQLMYFGCPSVYQYTYRNTKYAIVVSSILMLFVRLFFLYGLLLHTGNTAISVLNFGITRCVNSVTFVRSIKGRTYTVLTIDSYKIELNQSIINKKSEPICIYYIGC